MYFFYCPNCKYDTIIQKIPLHSCGNTRDGYGVAIYHSECPVCHNLDAGAMMIRINNNEERQYYRTVIEQYQGIRGFKQIDE